MSNAVKNFSVIYNNPFIFGPLFPSFYSSIGEKSKSILLSYLVLPLVLNPASLKFLVHVKSSSSVMTLVGGPGKRDRIYGLEERIVEYRKLTNTSLQYEIDIGVLSINKDLSVCVESDLPSEPMYLPKQLKASYNLGRLFKPLDVPTIYRSLGVKRL
jgi:hypothetical protein